MNKKLKDVWDLLPDLPYTKKYYCEKSKLNIYEICGKKFQETANIDYVLTILKKIESEIGLRARQALKNNFCDWKALSHALRVGKEVNELLTTQHITFPCPEAQLLLEVKQGKLPFKQVMEMVEKEMDTAEKNVLISTLPDKPDLYFVEDFLYKCHWTSLLEVF